MYGLISRLLRRDHQDQDQDLVASAHKASVNRSSGSHDFNIDTSSSSVHNSSCNDSKDKVYQSDPSRIDSYESYPNLSPSTSTSSTNTSQLQSEYGNNKSMEETKPTPLHDHQSNPFLSQSSSAKSKLPAKESQSRLPELQEEYGINQCWEGTKPTPSFDQSKPVVSEASSLTSGKDYFDVLRNAEDFYDEDHARKKTLVSPISELNFLGLPIRPGAKDCPYYMINGSCKDEANCAFNHPNPTVEGDSDSPLGYADEGSVSSDDASQASLGSWSSSRTLNGTLPSVPMMIPSNPLQNSEWNGYQDQELYAIANQGSEGNSHRYSSFESQASNIYTTSVPNSSCNYNIEPPSQLGRSQIYYYEHYPNVSHSTNISTISAKMSQLQAEYGNDESMQRTEPQPSPDQSKLVLSQSSSAEAKPSTTKSQSPSSLKPKLSSLPSNSTNQPKKRRSKRAVQKDTSPICMIPKDIKNLIKNGVVPDVLKKPLSQSTYKDYFTALLYAEDLYLEKWNNFQLLNVTLELPKSKNLKKSTEKDEKMLVALNIDSVAERQPVLLSRDFVFARCSGSKGKKFQGIVDRVVKSNLMSVEFDKEFYSQHRPKRQYNITFSFNRVCLRRAQQAISAAASGSLLHKYLFPEHPIRKNISSSSSSPCISSNHKLDLDSNSAVHRILSFKGHPPYLVEGPLCVSSSDKQKLSKTGLVVQEAVLQIYQRSSSTCRILICSPLNTTSDILLRSLKSEILESGRFRANGAFGEVDEIPDDILPLFVSEWKCSSLPLLDQLNKFRVIFSTFVSSYRLVQGGINVGHFSHIFLVDASSVTEPETMIPLSNLASKNTTVVLTGAPNNPTTWVRSDIAGENGLRTSYFERLRATKIYKSSDPAFIMHL